MLPDDLRPDVLPPDDPRQWLVRAAGNLRIAHSRLPGVEPAELCFNAHQAAEKAIKAVLIHLGIAYPHVHDLRRLLRLLSDTPADVPAEVARAARLTDYAVMARYLLPPKDRPTAEDYARWSRSTRASGSKWRGRASATSGPSPPASSSGTRPCSSAWCSTTGTTSSGTNSARPSGACSTRSATCGTGGRTSTSSAPTTHRSPAPHRALVSADVEVTLDIQARVPDGVPENVVRTVTENARTLKFTSAEFEEE
ncbi:MAG: HEPN domain-containing protein [Gemmatimonadetes bacterium]|nr:HEPN domain-containing protein [Gemmatimonadota bacterium]